MYYQFQTLFKVTKVHRKLKTKKQKKNTYLLTNSLSYAVLQSPLIFKLEASCTNSSRLSSIANLSQASVSLNTQMEHTHVLGVALTRRTCLHPLRITEKRARYYPTRMVISIGVGSVGMNGTPESYSS